MRELPGISEGKATWTFAADKHPWGKALTELIDYVSGQRKKSVIDPILNILNHNITTATLSANLERPDSAHGLNTYIEIAEVHGHRHGEAGAEDQPGSAP